MGSEPREVRPRQPAPIPLRTGEPVTTPRLPQPLAPFIGRQRERAELLSILRDPVVRLVTLTGPGGVGKTRLALQVGAELEPVLVDTVTFVSLAATTDPALVPSVVAETLGVSDGGTDSLARSIGLALGTRPALLIIDNFEQVLPASEWIGDLLRCCSALKVLVTSRSPLRLYGEYRFPVPPLSLPAGDPPATPHDPGPIRTSDAVSLFAERAHALVPSFVLSPENASTVAMICERLDGLPLAIELAASRVGELSPRALLERLEQRLPLLTRGPRDAPARHRTLRATVDWSYALLDPSQRSAFRRLAVCPGGCSLDAAEAIVMATPFQRPDGADGEPLPPVLDVLASLVEMSLLQHVPTAEGEPRFSMLETVREYALTQLVAGGELTAAQEAHAAHILVLVQSADQRLLRGSDVDRWLARLDLELPNIRAALAWYDEQGDGDALLALSHAMVQYWLRRSQLREGRLWAERAFRQASPASPAQQARALTDVARMAMYQQDAGADAMYRQARELAEAIGDSEHITAIRIGQVVHALIQGDAEGAVEHVDACVDRDREGLASDAQTTLIRALHALVVAQYGDVDLAVAIATECIDDARRSGNELIPALATRALAIAAQRRGDLAGALKQYQRALRQYDHVGEQWNVAVCLINIAIVIAERRPELALRLCGAASRVSALLGVPGPSHAHERYAHCLATIRSSLSAEAYAAAWQSGHDQPSGGAIAAALETTIAAPEPTTVVAPFGKLTRRERDVLLLLVEGKSDREIAAELGITYRTATTYVAGLLTKLNVSSRTAAATYAVRHKLV